MEAGLDFRGPLAVSLGWPLPDGWRFLLIARPTAGVALRRRAKGWSFVLAFWQTTRAMRIALAVSGALAAALPSAALAQGKLEAHYTVTLAGIPIGKGSWVIEIGNSRYSAAANGVTTGLMHVLTGGEGTTAAHGTLIAGKVLTATYAATIKSRKKTDAVRVTLEKGDVKDFKADPPPDHDLERVPVTEADHHGVLDPMTASLLATPGTGDPVSAEACQRTMAIFDGRMRYDLQLAFKRTDMVKADKGYAGPVVVCSVYFSPVGGYIPSRGAIRYIAKLREMEIWLAPIAGTRVLVPFLARGPTPIGEAMMRATEFVTVATPTTRASANGQKVP
jgi:Protein of unknown function (DUF3108)